MIMSQASLPIRHRCRRCRRRGSTGFTVFEMLTAVAVLALLAAFTVPSFREAAVNNATTGQVNEFAAGFAAARAEASKLQRTVRLSALGTWDAGWEVATDANQSGTLDGNDTVIRTGDPARTDFQVFVNTTGGTPVAHVWFNASGRLTGTAQPIEITIRRPDGDTARSGKLCVALTGRVESKKGENPCI